jgi:glycine/D-amino acid oxidase-like deaminating enzyme
MTIDFLIIGQGLAGSLLGWELIQRGCKVMVIDNGQENASQVAAGLINPVTGMRFVKSTDVDILLPTAKDYYSHLSRVFKETFFIEKPMLRLLRSESELQHCLKRLDQPDYQTYLGSLTETSPILQKHTSPFGILTQKQTGYLITRQLLGCLKQFFISKNSYRLANFDYRELQLEPSLSWQSLHPKQIIFCEGHNATMNPWFSYLPFQLVKGEILTLEHQNQLPDKLLNFQHWLIPLNKTQFRIGATFDRDNLNNLPTELGKHELLNALGALLPQLGSTNLLHHQANIRPCTLDKQPFIGRHPQYPQLSIFNGFGAKGSLQIPWYSQNFADYLLNKSPLHSTIQRHYATHFIS